MLLLDRLACEDDIRCSVSAAFSLLVLDNYARIKQNFTQSILIQMGRGTVSICMNSMSMNSFMRWRVITHAAETETGPIADAGLHKEFIAYAQSGCDAIVLETATFSFSPT